MLGVLYFVLASFVGYHLLKKVLPGVFKISKTISLFGKPVKLSNWMVTFPASFLIGTLIMTWMTYLSAYMLHSTSKPLFWGNVISFICFSIVSCFIVYIKRKAFKDFFTKCKEITVNDIGSFIKDHDIELIFIILALAAVTYIMFYTLQVKDGKLLIGATVYSDFGPHLSVIRSFSFGSNFPTEYPHFADGTIRYHFFFQFLAGNLEFLGMRLDYAFNIPSILSLVAFLMLFYSFSVMVMGKRWVGILAAMLFAFRSSFAFFTYITDKIRLENMSLWDALVSLYNNSGKHIGKTLHEEWGLFAQNVYVNQRHLAFSLGILILILIIVYPMFAGMVEALRKAKLRAQDEYNKQSAPDQFDNINPGSPEELVSSNTRKNVSFGSIYFKHWIQEFLLKKDAWLPRNLSRSVATGTILGLIAFWNGAVMVAAIPILFVLALLSKRRLEYLIIASITGLLAYVVQQPLFMGSAKGIKPQLTIGFLSNIPPDVASPLAQYASSNDISGILGLFPKFMPGILSYMVELWGILPFILLIAVFSVPKGIKRWISLGVLATVTALSLNSYMPDILDSFKYFIIGLVVLVLVAANILLKYPVIPRGGRWLALAFLTPVILANTLQVSPDIAINHKYIMISAILLNIIVAGLLFKLFATKKILAGILAGVMLLTMMMTGLADIRTLYNMNKGKIEYSVTDKTMVWAKDHTGPNEVFLTDVWCLHPILLAGRKIYSGWPYFTWGAGYDADARGAIANQIYGATDKQKLIDLVNQNKISYIVIDDGNRASDKPYLLNETLIQSTFEQVFEEPSSRTAIYRTNYKQSGGTADGRE